MLIITFKGKDPSLALTLLWGIDQRTVSDATASDVVARQGSTGISDTGGAGTAEPGQHLVEPDGDDDAGVGAGPADVFRRRCRLAGEGDEGVGAALPGGAGVGFLLLVQVRRGQRRDRGREHGL